MSVAEKLPARSKVVAGGYKAIMAGIDGYYANDGLHRMAAIGEMAEAVSGVGGHAVEASVDDRLPTRQSMTRLTRQVGGRVRRGRLQIRRNSMETLRVALVFWRHNDGEGRFRGRHIRIMQETAEEWKRLGNSTSRKCSDGDGYRTSHYLKYKNGLFMVEQESARRNAQPCIAMGPDTGSSVRMSRG